MNSRIDACNAMSILFLTDRYASNAMGAWMYVLAIV